MSLVHGLSRCRTSHTGLDLSLSLFLSLSLSLSLSIHTERRTFSWTSGFDKKEMIEAVEDKADSVVENFLNN